MRIPEPSPVSPEPSPVSPEQFLMSPEPSLVSPESFLMYLEPSLVSGPRVSISPVSFLRLPGPQYAG